MKFRNKDPEQLHEQLEQANLSVGTNIERTGRAEDMMAMSEEDLAERFPFRYKAYKASLNRDKPPSEPELVEMKKWLVALNNLDSYIQQHKHQLAEMEQSTLKPKQFDVFEDLRDFLEEGGREGYIKLPTGVGKTVIFIEFIESLKLNTFVVVPKNILVDQTIGEISKFAQGLDVGQINKEAKRIGKDVTLITYDSFVDGTKTGKLDPQTVDCLILDEAHRALGKETSSAIADQKWDHAIKIGFTATPKFTEEKQLKNLLETEIHSMEIAEAIQEGLLASCKVIIAKTRTDLTGVRVTASGEYNSADIEKAIDNEARTQSAIELYKEAFSGEKLILYCGNSVDYAKKVAEAFRLQGIPVEAIYGDQTSTVKGSAEQKEILRKLSTGEISGVTNAKILTEGFNEPTISVVFNLVPTRSLVEAEQRGGRALRLHPDKHIAVIVDFVDKFDEENQPVLFGEILTASTIPPELGNDRKGQAARDITSRLNSINIEGLEVVTHPQEVLQIINETTETRYQVRPEGWLSVGEIKEKYDISNWIVYDEIGSFILMENRKILGRNQETVNTYSDLRDLYYQDFKDLNGIVSKHCSPELIAAIIKRASLIIYEAPANTRPLKELQIELNIGREKLKELFEAASKGSSDEVFLVRARGSKASGTRYITKKLEDRIVELAHLKRSAIEYKKDFKENKENLPEGAIEKTTLAKYLQIDLSSLEKVSKNYSPEAGQVLNLKNGALTVEYWTPEYINKFLPELYKFREFQPNGWENRASSGWRGAIPRILRNHQSLVLDTAEKFRTDYPYMFWQMNDKDGKLLAEYYSPELRKMIAAEIKKAA